MSYTDTCDPIPMNCLGLFVVVYSKEEERGGGGGEGEEEEALGGSIDVFSESGSEISTLEGLEGM